METQIITSKRPAELVGQQISRQYANYLTNGFKQRFQGEQSRVFISKETILNSFSNLKNVSGIRFMYGFESADDPNSRVLILIPCNNTSTHLTIPNSIILPHGFIANTGERFGLEKAWQMLYNHTTKFGRYFPDLNFNKIMRGSFMGIKSLMTLIESENCDGIHFNFGYDDSMTEVSARNKPVFEAVDKTRNSLVDPPWDFTLPCPTVCDVFLEAGTLSNIKSSDSALHTSNEIVNYGQLRDELLLKDAANGPLIEMYYYVSPALNEKMATVQNSGRMYNEAPVEAYHQLLTHYNDNEAKEIFEKTMQNLMETYLFQ